MNFGKICAMAAAFASVAVFSGCSSVEVCRKANNTVMIQNSGCYLFYAVPLCSGDPDYPNQQVCKAFDDTVKLSTNMRLLNEEVANRKAKGVRNLVSYEDEESILWILLQRKIYRTSAELIP